MRWDGYGESQPRGAVCAKHWRCCSVCEGGRTSSALICPQKTVYGANVIVFEGILAFANKELLKVSLPDAAGGPSWCMAWEEAHGAALRGRGCCPGPALTPAGAAEWGSPAACWQSTSVSEDLGVSAGCHRCGVIAGRAVGAASETGLPRGCSPLPVFQLLDMKVFVDTDSDIRLVRRLQRDIMERGRDIVGVIKQYQKFVKPAFEQYIEPTVQVADIVVPRGEAAPGLPGLT